jgi:cation diffusion facilitator CzcD-associated flavoprotein CzcO
MTELTPRGPGCQARLVKYSMTDATQVPVVIIGAGQAGLSAAYYLRKSHLTAGRDFVIFDRGPL